MKAGGAKSQMRISGVAQYAFGVFATVAILAGCSSRSQVAPLDSMHQSAADLGLSAQGTRYQRSLSVAAAGVSRLNVDHSKSEMNDVRRDASNRLLYISDEGSQRVEVYNFPSKGRPTHAGKLTGLTFPQGECVDKARHHIFIANTGESQIWEFAYGAVKPTVELIDPGQYPVGCSIDPTTGNLAVTNIRSWASAPGSVSLYTPPFNNGNTPVSTVSDSTFSAVYFDSYDAHGNLFIDGLNGYRFQLAELPKGSPTFTDISISNAITFPGGVNYDAKRGYLDITDQTAQYQGAETYGYTVSGSMATLMQTTPMSGSCDIVQSSLIPGLGEIVGPDLCNVNANTYKYPAGGSPDRIITDQLASPIGSAILQP
jgi:DNA-binding beta-propeller fold protein YncE